MQADLNAHVSALNACNQRGGRMLSIIDLWEAGSVDLPLAAYLLAVMRRGVSLLVGAKFGGAGKTTVMCALLNLVPDDVSLKAVGSSSVLDAALSAPIVASNGLRTCYVAHEVGAGSYYAYVWGPQARSFFALAGAGHLIATNLHADTLHETRTQLCAHAGTPQGIENDVEPADLAAVQLKLYLGAERAIAGGVHRWVRHVYEGEFLLWAGDGLGTFHRNGASALVSAEDEREATALLEEMHACGLVRIEDVRRTLLG